MLCTAEQTIANEDEGVEGLTGKRTVIATAQGFTQRKIVIFTF